MRQMLFVAILAVSGCGQEIVGDPSDPSGSGTGAGTGTGTGVVDDVPAVQPGRVERYPIVFAHGMGGFEHIGPIDYFYGVKDAMAASGHEAYFSIVDPLNTSDVRGGQLLAFVEGVIAKSGKHKVHLVGHSQGGFDVRWVAARRPDLIASVTTIATPHRGTPVADVGLGLMPGNTRDVLGALGNLYGMAMGFESDLSSQLVLLSTDGAAAFNARTPDVQGIPYYSITGRTRLRPDGAGCAPDGTMPGFIARYAGMVDPTDPVMYIPAGVIDGAGIQLHDGLVPVESARWGKFLGCIPADHTDEICQIASDAPGVGNGFDCHRFYQDLAAFLQGQ